MKSYFLIPLLFTLLLARHCFAQQDSIHEETRAAALPVIGLPANISLHFVSPQPIRYVDISSKGIIGDLPLPNLLRIRLKDSVATSDAIVTIAGEDFLAQYHVMGGINQSAANTPTEIEVMPQHMQPLHIEGTGWSQSQLRSISLNLFCKPPGHVIEHTKAFDLKAELNHIYTAGDYIFLDVSYRNKTKLRYDLDAFHFAIDDKKVNKASNVQSVPLKPEFVLFDQPVFNHYYRNIIVLRKLTFPGNKQLHIELSEKQYSGRVITLSVSYQDVLDADIVPLH